MFYLDSQRTLTRRDSSLVVPKKPAQILDTEYEGLSTARALSTAHLTSESSASLIPRPTGSVRKEIVTMLFESMVDSIVESWQVIVQHKPEESQNNVMKTVSEVTFTSKKKKPAVRPSKTKKSRSRLDVDNGQTDPLLQSWWSSPDEKAIIRFKNGNLYEGNISMKCMNGQGRFQWADGTVYLGEFKDNEIKGKGLISWKDDCWYEGEFVGNLRHGKGLYVDSRRQRSYTGGWYCGTKHGQGVIYYSDSFKNSYDGEWIHNVRHGFGTREYCRMSGYKGEWDRYVRDGKGLMIWPNHDFYRGEWRNGVMSGYGIYIWDTYHNNSMSLPSLTAYRGNWVCGQRNGYGVLNLGSGMGSHYKGEFKNNKKNGGGKFVSNNGLILKSKWLFEDDILGPRQSDRDVQAGTSECKPFVPFQFDICDSSVGLLYHIQQALNNMDKQAEIRDNLLNDYMEYNQLFYGHIPSYLHKDRSGLSNFEDMVAFEERSLRKSLRCYETELQNIYYKYATICNCEKINFTPILIRLYLWQLYFDCNIHEKGLTLVEIDMIYDQNKEWKTGTPHGPFDKIYYWQFLNSLISVASRLYAKRHQPGPRPDTILASAFRTFMENDILPGCGRCNGHLVQGFGSFVPLQPLYALYRSLGEPHTVRQFLCAVRRPPHYTEDPRPNEHELVEAHAPGLPIGYNAYIIGDEMMFVSDEQPLQGQEEILGCADLSLFNFGNLSSKAIIKIFAKIFPQLCSSDVIMDLEIQITFFEFFEAFLACAEESIKVKDEEIRWREKFSAYNMNIIINTRQSHAAATSRTAGNCTFDVYRETQYGRMRPKVQNTVPSAERLKLGMLLAFKYTPPKVKTENWDYVIHAEMKDNYVYRDQLSNHLSTYVRWGTEDQGVRMTETRHMLAQIFTRTDPVYSFKPLVNFTSYPCTDTPGRNKLMKNADLAQLPPEFGITDYLTSQQDDYRNPFPSVTRPLTMASPTWLLNRVIRSDLTHNHGTAPPRGDYQCLDTHTPIGHIRQMRLFRYQSFNPATCGQDFPTFDKPLDTY